MVSYGRDLELPSRQSWWVMRPSPMNTAIRRRWSRAWLVSSLALLALSLPPAVTASPIRSRTQISAQAVRDLRSWVAFLNGGQQLWSHVKNPPVTLAVRRLMAQALSSSNPTSSPWVQYLTWRRDLNPVRFDHWHPFLGPELQNLTPPTQPQILTPPSPSVPEPGTLVMSLALVGTGVWWRRRMVTGL